MGGTSRTLGFGLAALAIAAAGGCKKASVQATNESAEAVAEKVAQSSIRPEPGQWESRMVIEKMDMAGVPPEAKAMMQQQMGQEQRFVSCLTPEQAARPQSEFFQKGTEGCTYDSFSMQDGKIAGTMSCDREGRKQTMDMAGTYGPREYRIRMSTTSEVAKGMRMSMTMRVTSTRIGECKGKDGE